MLLVNLQLLFYLYIRTIRLIIPTGYLIKAQSKGITLKCSLKIYCHYITHSYWLVSIFLLKTFIYYRIALSEFDLIKKIYSIHSFLINLPNNPLSKLGTCFFSSLICSLSKIFFVNLLFCKYKNITSSFTIFLKRISKCQILGS